MYIKTNKEACDEIKQILVEQVDKPQSVRIFIAGMACSGPNFGLGLDTPNENDYEEVVEGVKFVIEKGIYDTMGEILIEWMGNGYAVRPVNQAPFDCGSCSACG